MPGSTSPTGEGERGHAVAALVVVQLLFGVHYSVAREITAAVDPIAWTVLRASGAALLLALLLSLTGRRWPRGAGLWLRLTGLALLGVTINQLLFNAGISRSTAIHGVLVMATLPAQTLALAVLLGDERLDRRKLASVLLGLVGVVVLLGFDRALAAPTEWLRARDGGPATSFGESVLAGDLMMLGNSLSYALYIALGRRVFAGRDPLALSAALYLLGALSILVFGGGSLAALDFAVVPAAIWGLGLFVVVGPTIGTYLLNIYALQRLPSSLVGLFIYLQFVVAAFTGASWHGEALDARVVVAALLVLGGLALRVVPERTREPGLGARTKSQAPRGRRSPRRCSAGRGRRFGGGSGRSER